MPLLARSWLLMLAAGALLASPAPAADRYVAWLADGTKLSANFIPAWPVPGLPYRLENDDLLSSKNPVRLMRDRTIEVKLQPPYVVLANGDILSGSPVALEAVPGRSVPRVKVQLEPPLMPVVGTGLLIRADRILRIVGTIEAARTEPPPGTVVLADGRRLAGRAIRWRESGLAVLTPEGIVDVAFGELADAVFPDVDRTAAVLDDNTWASSNASSSIVRFQMAGGSVVTATRVRREVEQSRRRRLTTTVNYYVQPAWSDQPLALPELQIAGCGYRQADQAPLSLLPSTTLANERLIGQVQPWLANRTADGGLLTTAGGRESDLGVWAHAHSAIAFDLPAGAKSLDLAVALDKAVGNGGCVRCKVLAEDQKGKLLWDTGIFQGRDGFLEPRSIDVGGLRRVVLVADYAHDGRPDGADPLDIRDQVVWLAPTVKMESSSGRSRRVASLLSGLDEWEPVGTAWDLLTLESRWNVLTRSWDTLVIVPRERQLQLRRKLRIGTADVLELMVACPTDRDEHDFLLSVNGTEVEATNNADRLEQRRRIQNYGRMVTRDEIDDQRFSDRLAYWWDLSRWSGQEVTLELTLRGGLPRNEIAWRSLATRCPIGNLPEGGQPLKSNVALTSVAAIDIAARASPSRPLADAIPRNPRYGEPIRFLGRQFSGGYGLARNSSISFPLKPEYRKFVAVAGCSYHLVGPMQVLIDDQVVWERPLVNSLTPAEQIEINIPAGSQRLTLLCGSDSYNGFAAWAEAGFVTK